MKNSEPSRKDKSNTNEIDTSAQRKKKHIESALVTQRKKQLILKGDGRKLHTVAGTGVEPGTSLKRRRGEKVAFLKVQQTACVKKDHIASKSRELWSQTQKDHSSFSLRKRRQANESPCIPFSHVQNKNNSVYFTGIKHDHECEVQSCTE